MAKQTRRGFLTDVAIAGAGLDDRARATCSAAA